MEWNTTSYHISKFRDWYNDNTLIIQPDFQRKSIWTEAAQISLIDTIFKDIPIPKLYLAIKVSSGSTKMEIIDGQQRMTAILTFLDDNLVLKEPFFTGDFAGMSFKEIEKCSPKAVEKFLTSKVDVTELVNSTEEETRELFIRVNKYTKQLNSQEIRRVDFYGDFSKLCEDLAEHSFFDEAKMFTTASRKRMKDVEYVSNLVILLMDGLQNKSDNLDEFYIKYIEWDHAEKEKVIEAFNKILEEISILFDSENPISKTRFRQKADFYSLFKCFSDLVSSGATLDGLDLELLRKDFKFLNEVIEPHSSYPIFKEYAVRCISDSNSISTRKWRANLIRLFINGTVLEAPLSDAEELFTELHLDYLFIDLMCDPSSGGLACPICGKFLDDTGFDKEKLSVCWSKGEQFFQYTNSVLCHKACK